MKALSRLSGLLALAVAAAAPAWAQPVAPASPGPAAAAQTPVACAPPTLFRTVVRDISPGLTAADRRAQPREIWRQGVLFLRSVEQPLPPSGDQRTVIIAEPDIWVISDAARTAQHAVDPGPVLEVKAPILPMVPGLPKEFAELEYGCELAFIARYAPTPVQTLKWGRDEAALHTFAVGDQSVAILITPRLERPVMLSYIRQGKPVFVLRYDEYRSGYELRPQLFAPPKGYQIVEAPRPSGPLD